ncbi:MAG: hypothetical protein WC382_02950 [Methanoregulaceae archaeon]|jgi:ABC-type antimicrobial peptide transport system permease subunit
MNLGRSGILAIFVLTVAITVLVYPALPDQYALWFAIVPILIISVYMVISSYVEYGKEPRTEG